LSTLLIDIGNTRVKWALYDGHRLGRQHAAAHSGWTSNQFARHVFARARGVDRVLAVSVAGARVDRMVTAAARSCLSVKPEFFASARRVAGVTTLYSEPWRLGADRLAAAIGAHRIARGRAVCVIGVGTALTVDLVDAEGRHRGGAIVPAPELMKGSLLTKTNGIARRARGATGKSGFFARNTRAAIEQGARYAAAAVVDRAVEEARALLGRTPLVLLTGGGVPAIRQLVRCRNQLVPDLVLQGLAVIAHSTPELMGQPISKTGRRS
jgi:type III pantothenate kinase